MGLPTGPRGAGLKNPTAPPSGPHDCLDDGGDQEGEAPIYFRLDHSQLNAT
jgi:hypothetical protein